MRPSLYRTLDLMVTFIAVALAAYAIVGLDRYVERNRELSCSTARLVAYVPAIQFEGEPRENFLGWLRSRRDMLVAVEQGNNCSAETTQLLRERVRLDEQALEDLRP